MKSLVVEPYGGLIHRGSTIDILCTYQIPLDVYYLTRVLQCNCCISVLKKFFRIKKRGTDLSPIK